MAEDLEQVDERQLLLLISVSTEKRGHPMGVDVIKFVPNLNCLETKSFDFRVQLPDRMAQILIVKIYESTSLQR